MNIVSLCLLPLLIWASIVDIRTYRIPNYISLGGWPLMLLLQGLTLKSFPFQPLLFSLLFSVPLIILSFASKGHFGMGDAKLSLPVGAALGLPDSWLALLFSCITAIAYNLLKRQGKEEEEESIPFPFAPYLTVGVILQIVNRYLSSR